MKPITTPNHVDPSAVEVAASATKAQSIGHGLSASFNPDNGVLQVFGTNADDSLVMARDAAGTLLLNGGALHLKGGTPTVANTSLVEIFGQAGNDVISIDEANGALPAAMLFGGAGNDTITGGSGNDQLFGQIGDDILLGKGGDDLLFGGDGNDTITGGAGSDQMYGEAGNDRLIWNPGDGSDIVDGGTGTDTLEVNGGNGAETFTVTADGTQFRLDRVVPAPFSITATAVEELVINANGGDDTITAGNGLSTLVHLTIDGGQGNDTITGGDGNDNLFGGDGNDTITGGRGADVAQLGAGDDAFVWNPGDGSDVVEGGDGSDTMLFNGANIAEEFNISANGSRALFTRNIGTVTMDLNSVETVQVATLGGNDTVNVHDLTGSGVDQVNINLGASGGGPDGAPDIIKIDGTQGDDVITLSLRADGALVVDGLAAEIVITNYDVADQIQILGLGGDDVIQANFVPANGATLVFDGGAGNDVLIGSDGNDVLLGGDGDDVLIGNAGNDQLDGGTGANTLIQ